MPSQRYYVKRMKSVDPQINLSLFSYIFKRVLWCVLSHQANYSEFHSYQKSLNTPLIIIQN